MQSTKPSDLPDARHELGPTVWYWADWLWWIPLIVCALYLLAELNDLAAGARQGIIHLAWVEIVFMFGTIAVGIALVALASACLTRRVRTRPMLLCIGLSVAWFISQYQQMVHIIKHL